MGKEKKDKKPSTHSVTPKINVQVMSAKSDGSKVTVEFSTNRHQRGDALDKDKKSLVIECSGPEHADILARHCMKLHARNKKTGLVWTIKSLATDVEKLAKARIRSAKMKTRRVQEKKEREDYKHMLELRRQKME